MVVDDFRHLPDDSIWPTLIPRVVEQIQQHNTTLVLSTTAAPPSVADRINAQMFGQENGDSGVGARGVAHGLGMFAAGKGTIANPIRAHHGSMSKRDAAGHRAGFEGGQAAGAGGYFIAGAGHRHWRHRSGGTDSVAQIGGTGVAARSLAIWSGRPAWGASFPTHREDVMEAAAVAGGMLRGEVEPTHTPQCAGRRPSSLWLWSRCRSGRWMRFWIWYARATPMKD
ncbi:MAG: hypothetical protein R2911_20740 [Caldilineaceae bacterium]